MEDMNAREMYHTSHALMFTQSFHPACYLTAASQLSCDMPYCTSTLATLHLLGSSQQRLDHAL